jgi:hypothetical protein
MGGLPVDNTQHGGHHVNSKDIVGIGEETNTGHGDCSDVVPYISMSLEHGVRSWGSLTAKGSLVDLGEGESSSLVRVGNMGEVVVEVVKGGIAT